jgi:DnaK suppressor protein
MTQKPSLGKLTDAQLAELRQVLLNKRRELLGQLSRNANALGEPASSESDLMDQAEAAIEHDDRAQRSTRESALLDEIDRALRSFKEGSYGISEESGEPIGYDRLRAVPWARRTAREEEELERR